MVQNIFFRRYGLNDTGTTALKSILLVYRTVFRVSFKFLFSVLFLQGRGFPFSDAGQVVKLFYIYGGGYAAIHLFFTAMYWNAFRHRKQPALTAREIFEIKTNIYWNLVMSGIGLLSMAHCLIRRQVYDAGRPYLYIGRPGIDPYPRYSREVTPAEAFMKRAL